MTTTADLERAVMPQGTVRERMGALGLTERSLLAKLEGMGLVVSQSTVERWVRGTFAPNFAAALVLAEALGVTPNALMGMLAASAEAMAAKEEGAGA